MITVTFLNGCILATAEQSLWQYSYNQQLEIIGLELPEVFTVDFCNTGNTQTVAMIGSNNVVDIPNELLMSGSGITAYVFQKSALTGGITRCEIRIDVLPRPERDDETPTPEQEAVIDQLIAELNEGVEKAEAAADSAEEHATAARESATTASEFASAAVTAAQAANDSEQAASVSAETANSSADIATSAASAASGSASSAAEYASNAAGSATAAAYSSTSARDSAIAAGASATAAAGSASDAATAKTAAEAAQTAAAGSAADASDSADSAAASATAAANSSTAAAASATAAGNAKTAAETAQGLAEDAQEAAEQAQSDAEDAAESVSQSAAQIEQNRQDIDDLKNVVNDPVTGLNTKAPVIIDTASGSIAHFDDGADDMPIKALTVNIEPVQDLNGYDNPWPAGGGINKVNAPDVTLTSGSYLYNGAFVIPAGTYTINFDSTAGASKIATVLILDEDGNQLASGGHNMPWTFTTTATSATMRLYVGGAGTYSNIQINEGSTALPYAPYENICPISGLTDATVVQTGDDFVFKTLNANIDGTGTVISSSVKYRVVVAPVKSGFEYTIAGDISTIVIGFFAQDPDIGSVSYDGTRIIQTEKTFIAPIDGYACVRFAPPETAPMVCIGKAVNISWGDTEAGTVYGGTLDVVSGKLVAYKGIIIYDGSPDEVIRSYTGARFTLGCSDYVSPVASIKDSIISNELETVAKNSQGSRPYLISGSDRAERNFMINVGLNTVADVRTWLANNPLQVCYPLATPIEITLTPTEITTLLGTNNIWADCGPVSVDYPADTKLYIQKINAPTDDDMTADARIESGQYFLINNTLYLSTTIILAGDTIIPGTNCTKTDLAAALNALNT